MKINLKEFLKKDQLITEETLSEGIIPSLYNIILKSMVNELVNFKNTTQPTCVVFTDSNIIYLDNIERNIEFILGAKVKYHENENKDIPGNWSLELSIDEDIQNESIIIDVSVLPGFIDRLVLQFKEFFIIEDEDIKDICILIKRIFGDDLKRYLNRKIVNDYGQCIHTVYYYETSLTIPNLCIINSDYVSDEDNLYLDITPSATLKQIIKDDKLIEI